MARSRLTRYSIWGQRVKEYAKTIGLASTKNYNTYYDQKGKSILWNVSACEPFAFKPKEWKFPLLGSFAYKGFFDLEKARQEEKIWGSKGYDTNIRSVGAWSTLGWLNDPILSNMLERSIGNLAELIFHELTHSTVFISDSLEFNENLASFIGEKATIQFLIDQYGVNSPQLEVFRMENQDASKYRSHILNGRVQLDSLYQSFTDKTDIEKLKLKNLLIDSIVSNIDTITFHESFYYDLFSEKRPNNAYFMSFKRYYHYKDELEIIYNNQRKDISAFINYCRNTLND